MVTWKRTTHDLYWQNLEVLPPAVQTGYGFLIGEAWRHRKCEATGAENQPAFAAFVERRRHDRKAEYFLSQQPMTKAEFRALDPSTIEVVS